MTPYNAHTFLCQSIMVNIPVIYVRYCIGGQINESCNLIFATYLHKYIFVSHNKIVDVINELNIYTLVVSIYTEKRDKLIIEMY